jgi:ligand-binding sensor domain-containing protein
LHNNSVINNAGLQLNAINSVIEDNAGNIWFATWFEGVCRYDGKSITNFKPFGEVWFTSVLQDKNGNIWVGSRAHGAYRYDGKTFTNFFADTKIFNACTVCAIAEDKSGNIWFGTQFADLLARDSFGGVWCYNPSASLSSNSKALTNFTTKDRLSHNGVFSITIDRSGTLWFGTLNTGLCSYDGKTFTNFSE